MIMLSGSFVEFASLIPPLPPPQASQIYPSRLLLCIDMLLSTSVLQFFVGFIVTVGNFLVSEYECLTSREGCSMQQG